MVRRFPKLGINPSVNESVRLPPSLTLSVAILPESHPTNTILEA